MTLQRQNGTFELTLSIFIWIVVLLGAAVWVLIPETKTYLRLQETAEANTKMTARVQQEYDGLYAQKEATEAEAAALAEQWENRADAASLWTWVRTVRPDAEVTGGADPGVFKVRTVMATPAEFYRLVERLDTAPWVLGVEAPIIMRAENGAVAVTFTLRAARQAAETSPLQN
jgi:hypothetical protein